MVATIGPPLLEVAARIGATKFNFVVDTGSSVSIIPPNLINGTTINASPVKLSSADGKCITCHGESIIDVSIPALRRKYNWNFVIADTCNALLGADFLSHFNILVDCKAKKIIDKITSLCVPYKEDCNLKIQQITINNVTEQSIIHIFYID